MKRWTMWMAVALMAAAVPVARLAVAQDHPAHAPDAAHDAADDDGGGDWVALDVEAAMVEGPAMGGHGGFGGGRHGLAWSSASEGRRAVEGTDHGGQR